LRPATLQLAECLGHRRRHFARVVDAPGPFGQAAQDGELVRNFMQHAIATAEVAGRDLTRKAQHRGVAAIGRGQGRGGVQEAWPGHNGKAAYPAGRLGIAEGHIGGRLFVPHLDHPYGVAFVVQRI
jgi:hypothetical protein